MFLEAQHSPYTHFNMIKMGNTLNNSLGKANILLLKSMQNNFLYKLQ